MSSQSNAASPPSKVGAPLERRSHSASENPKNEAFIRNGNFALQTLSAEHRLVAEAFSGATGLPPEERFALAVFDCEIIDTKDLATHRVYFGKVTGLRVGERSRPLLYHDRGYHVL